MTNKSLPAFHIIAKPAGARCNLACNYCFYLKREKLYPASDLRMNDEVLEGYIRQMLETPRSRQVTIAWQGGEPTLMGLDFFKKSIELERKYQKPGTDTLNTIQTNGFLLDEKWCSFLHEHNFLVGLSLDGPRELHDAYRMDKQGRSVFDKVMRAVRLLRQQKIKFNILTTINAANADYPMKVYRFLRDEIGARFMQFVPVIERANEGFGEGMKITEQSVRPEKYGAFLNSIFDEWVRRDVGQVFVNHFDAALASWIGASPAICTAAPACGFAMALEHNGDLFSCDHFVEPAHFLGNILEKPLIELAASEKQRMFGNNKHDNLPQQCRRCEFLFACNGECPKNRFLKATDGEPGLNYLCTGLKSFFANIEGSMTVMTELLHRRRPPSEIMNILPGKRDSETVSAKTGRNDLCPCGSGLKFKRCHGR